MSEEPDGHSPAASLTVHHDQNSPDLLISTSTSLLTEEVHDTVDNEKLVRAVLDKAGIS